jgi:hypothetical protein
MILTSNLRSVLAIALGSLVIQKSGAPRAHRSFYGILAASWSFG